MHLDTYDAMHRPLNKATEAKRKASGETVYNSAREKRQAAEAGRRRRVIAAARAELEAKRATTQ